MYIKNYINLCISLISLILAIFILNSANIVYALMQENNIAQDEPEIIEKIDHKEKIEYVLTEKFEGNWYIEIPKISLIAPIAEGTTQEVMSKDVGHFENTSIWEGNIGLAAHNRRMCSKLFWKN